MEKYIVVVVTFLILDSDFLFCHLQSTYCIYKESKWSGRETTQTYSESRKILHIKTMLRDMSPPRFTTVHKGQHQTGTPLHLIEEDVILRTIVYHHSILMLKACCFQFLGSSHKSKSSASRACEHLKLHPSTEKNLETLSTIGSSNRFRWCYFSNIHSFQLSFALSLFFVNSVFLIPSFLGHRCSPRQKTASPWVHAYEVEVSKLASLAQLLRVEVLPSQGLEHGRMGENRPKSWKASNFPPPSFSYIWLIFLENLGVQYIYIYIYHTWMVWVFWPYHIEIAGPKKGW